MVSCLPWIFDGLNGHFLWCLVFSFMPGGHQGCWDRHKVFALQFVGSVTFFGGHILEITQGGGGNQGCNGWSGDSDITVALGAQTREEPNQPRCIQGHRDLLVKLCMVNQFHIVCPELRKVEVGQLVGAFDVGCNGGRVATLRDEFFVVFEQVFHNGNLLFLSRMFTKEDIPMGSCRCQHLAWIKLKLLSKHFGGFLFTNLLEE